MGEGAALALFEQSIFGPYLKMPFCNFLGQIIKCLLFLEIEHENIDEIHIRHGKGNVLYFTPREFSIIIGLKFTSNIDDFKYSDESPSKSMQRYLLEPGISVN